MDPLSGVASVIAVIGAANVVLQSIHKLIGILKAPEVISALIEDIEALRALFNEVKEAQELLKKVNPSLHQIERC